MRWLNFRYKITLGYLLLFVLFMVIVYPFIGKAVDKIVYHNLEINSEHLIEQLKKSKDQKDMMRYLQGSQAYFFFRISLFDPSGDMIFDSAYGEIYDKRDLDFSVHHPEIAEQVKKGIVFSQAPSKILNETLAYVSLPFEAHGTAYILRTAIPYRQLEQFTVQFEHWFLIFCGVALLFLGGCIWLIFHRINYPISQIIKVIKPYQSGQINQIPQIQLSHSIDEHDNFYQLADTLNSLSYRLRRHVQQLVEERNEKEAILESLGEGVIAIDADMNITYANYIGCRMLGISKKQLMGKSFSALVVKAKFALVDKCRKLLETCQKMSTILTDSIFLEDGKKIYLDLIAAPKQHGSGAILVLQDKSSHYKVLEMGKDFVANASHELRTPITIIRGFAETLYDMPELPREMVSDITEKIVRNCQRMDNLVKNLLTLADLENLPESRFQECDLVALAENCRQVINAIYEGAQINIEKNNEAINVDADPDILELAIINLLDNAAKYSKPPAHITIKIERIAEEARIAISDRGIGIPPDDLSISLSVFIQ